VESLDLHVEEGGGIDGDAAAFLDEAGEAFLAPERDDALLTPSPAPWAIWTGNAESGAARRIWASSTALRASYPDVAGGANLYWPTADRLTFLSAASNWQNL
jgi:hypothetical protein